MDRTSKKNWAAVAAVALVIFGAAYFMMRPTQPRPGNLADMSWDSSRSEGTAVVESDDTSNTRHTPIIARPPPCPTLASPESNPAVFCKGCAEWNNKYRQWDNLRTSRNDLFDTADPNVKRHSVDFILLPQWKCQDVNRVGFEGDGGKNVCMDSFPKGDEDCLVYSVGSHGDYSFEAAIHALNPNCEIHIFDPTWQPPPKDAAAIKNISATYHTIGFNHQHAVVNGWLGPLERFATVVKQLKHKGRKINIFKIDCEGCEWRTFLIDIFPSMLLGEVDFDQLLIELHLNPANFYNLVTFFHMADGLGLKLFASEFNRWAGPADYCSEFSFSMNKGPANCAHPVCKDL